MNNYVCLFFFFFDRFAIVEPTQRPGVDWYFDSYENLRASYSRMISALGLINLSIIKYSDLPSQLFDPDGVHLTSGMGVQFVNAVIYFAGQIFEASVVDLEEDSQMETVEAEEVASGSAGIVQLNSDQVRTMTTEEKLLEVIADMEKRRANDDLVFARIREELDFIVNSRKEDRIVITGLSTDIPRPRGDAEVRGWARAVVNAALHSFVPDSDKNIQFCSLNRSVNAGVPVCEVKFREREVALKVRKEFGKMRKEKRYEGRIFISNCVTLGTRVRTEILKAIARKCSSPSEDMYVHGFTSRPVLQVKPKNGGAQLALTFVDAIVRYGRKVREADLTLAYERAGTSFAGQMGQNFIVLTDKGVKQGGRQSRGGGGAGRVVLTGANKRALDDGNDNDNGNEAKRQVGSNGRGGASGRGGVMARGGKHTPGKK